MTNYVKIVDKPMIHKAIAQIRSHDDSKVLGYIELNEDMDGITHIFGNLSGLVSGKHGIHIHEKGDPRQCCNALGGHYNPFNKQHGDIKDDREHRHVGDLGNILFDDEGKCKVSLYDKLIKITGPYSVIGRSIIIHEKEDDLGTGSGESKVNGNSGARIAYGIIGYA